MKVKIRVCWAFQRVTCEVTLPRTITVAACASWAKLMWTKVVASPAELRRKAAHNVSVATRGRREVNHIGKECRSSRASRRTSLRNFILTEYTLSPDRSGSLQGKPPTRPQNPSP